MALKDSVFGMVLASSVVATVITLSYDTLIIPLVEEKKLEQSEKEHALRFAQTVNIVVRGQGFQNAVSRQDFLLTVLMPLYEHEPKYKPIILQLIALDSSEDAAGNVNDAQVTAVNEVRTTPETIAALEAQKAIPKEYSVEALRADFYSGYRRQLSDALVREIDNGRDELPERLIEALIEDNDEPKSYRINLYVAYTLARVEAWSAPEHAVKTFMDLTGSPNYIKDPTFKRRVDEAIQKIAAE